MSDLSEELEKAGNDPVEIASSELYNGLLWTDDLLMLSRSEKGLQNMLDILYDFSEKNPD